MHTLSYPVPTLYTETQVSESTTRDTHTALRQELHQAFKLRICNESSKPSYLKQTGASVPMLTSHRKGLMRPFAITIPRQRLQAWCNLGHR